MSDFISIHLPRGGTLAQWQTAYNELLSSEPMTKELRAALLECKYAMAELKGEPRSTFEDRQGDFSGIRFIQDGPKKD
jgi:hypothetical protein